MPNNNIVLHPKGVIICLCIHVARETVNGFVGSQLPEQLLLIAKQGAAERTFNFLVQYGGVVIAATPALERVDPLFPMREIAAKGVAEIMSSGSPEEAAIKMLVSGSAVTLSIAASADTQTSLAFGSFIAILVTNILAPGAHSVLYLTTYFWRIYWIKTILFRIILEIQVEYKRRKLKLPRKFPNIFKRRKPSGPLTVEYLRLKKQKINGSRFWIPKLYTKQLIIRNKQLPMIQHIPIS